MLFAMLLRRPRKGRTSSCASGSRSGGGGALVSGRVLFSVWASTSAFITLPCGPDPWSAPRSTPISRAIRRGLGIVTVALSVITSTSGWSSTIWSPAFTSHLTISPSTTPSPMSGSLNSKWAMSGLVGFQLAQRLEDARRERQVLVFQRVWERRVPAGDARDWRLQGGEAALLHQRADLRREPVRTRRFLHDRAAPGLAHAARDRLDV